MSLYTFTSKQKVSFFDCDPMGVVWHGNYLKYLEVARGESETLIMHFRLLISNLNILIPCELISSLTLSQHWKNTKIVLFMVLKLSPIIIFA